ncbi:E6 [Apodemus sylvaticus papillomavirus 1]|uniref:Protein E6 n=1 Tax=Apodemus sylvaticus papillomavirus 1 TaxID=1036963 RepID=F8SIM3_9PAPI|nr:E6 [Apodemus sylvaticus papillomavirus 1]AEI00709.1 E6 [Apodemus sylvaticus papillomavirus 1]
MDVAKDYTLNQLLRFLDVSLTDFILPCAFCPSFLDLNDKQRFAASELRVVVKDFTFQGACLRCRKKLAFAERQKYQSCIGEGDLVEAMWGTGIVHITVRCIRCLGLLSASEKLLAKANYQPFYLVRSLWRGHCRLCFNLQ